MIFHKNSLRLAGLYLGIIMAISLFFSASLYNISLRELGRGLRGPNSHSIIEDMPGFESMFRQQLQDERQDQFEQARSRVIQSLFVINLLILVGAGFLSYYLAYRTLKPIEEAHEAQARFTSDASHELRTPIAAMQTETEVALMDPELSLDEAKRQLTSNLEELSKLTALTEGLLGLARYDDAQINKDPIKVESIVSAALERVTPLAKQKKISIDVPQEITEQVQGNSLLLTEALVIVIDNAVKYSDEKTTISIDISQSHKGITIAVSDHGQGIRATELPHIFDRFYRADAARNKQKVDGYGLGLSLARRIVELHGGTITVTSKVGEGSKFSINIPLV